MVAREVRLQILHSVPTRSQRRNVVTHRVFFLSGFLSWLMFFGTEGTLEALMTSRIEKPWGHEEIWAETASYVGKLLVIKPGEKLSRQYHNFKEETFRVLTGDMTLELGADASTSLSMGPRRCCTHRRRLREEIMTKLTTDPGRGPLTRTRKIWHTRAHPPLKTAAFSKYLDRGRRKERL